MSVDALKKRKPKVIRNEGGTPEGKRMRGEGDQEARVYSEEVELEMRNPAQDYTLYKQTCEMLTRLMAEIHELKSSSSKDSAAEMEERRMQSCIHFMTLKKLNRVAHMRLKKGRDQTHEAKQRVDALHLQLQNLLYEVMHLQKEINKCLEFKSKHEEIELVSVEEFRRDAPPEISRPEISGADPHQLTLCRLDWELEQRKRLAEKYKESLASKEKIMKGIEIKKEYLSSLQPQLTEIMQASRPVQDYLSMPFEQTQKQNEVARHLPPPLYVLLVQANAYGQACDKKLSVSIIGDVNEAKALSKPPEDSQDDESDSDAEEEQNTKRRRPTLGVQLDDKRKEMLKRHPLSVSVDLQCKDGSVLHLFFYYLMNLDIMTVKVKVTAGTELSGAISAGELLSPESLLNCLYPGDQGTETPNPANRYQFDKVGILMFGDYVAELGHPYTWVQLITSHPHYDKQGNTYNMGTSIADKGKTRYTIFKVPPKADDSAKKKLCLKNLEVVCSIPCRSLLHPSYYHSFGMTDNYIIFIEQPFKLDILKMATAYFRGVNWASCLQFDADDNTLIHLIDRRTQKPVPTKFYTDALVVYHHVNAYEEDGHVVCDIIAYKDSSLYDMFYLANLQEPLKNNKLSSKPSCRRFVLPLQSEKDAAIGNDLVKLKSTTATAVKEKEGSLFCHPEILCEGAELPRINYDFNGKKHRYVYITGVELTPVPTVVMKFDVDTRQMLEWKEDNCWPSELVFVPSPNAIEEDDGVVLSVVVCPDPNKAAFLLVLDAKTFKEIARASVDVDMHVDMHGYFIPPCPQE